MDLDRTVLDWLYLLKNQVGFDLLTKWSDSNQQKLDQTHPIVKVNIQ